MFSHKNEWSRFEKIIGISLVVLLGVPLFILFCLSLIAMVVFNPKILKTKRVRSL